MKLTITKEFQWDSAHKLCLYKASNEENEEIFGPCSRIHGHRYKLLVTVSSIDSSLENGMVVNFTDLKEIVNTFIVKRFDHMFLNDDELYQFRETTCENQIKDIWEILEKPLLEINCKLEKLRLYETPTSYATLRRKT